MADVQRDAEGQVRSASDEVRDALPYDRALAERVVALEKFTSARAVAVTTNGRFPFWSFERWVSVLTFASVLIGGIWFAGGQWQDVKRDIDAVRSSVDSMKSFGEKIDRLDKSQQDLKDEIQRIERADEYYRTNPPRGARIGRSGGQP